MRLEIDGEPALDDPTAEDVRRTVARLSPQRPTWAVLDLGVNYYIQTKITEDEQFLVEYRDGGPEVHYKADGSQDRDDVIDAFLDYFDNGNKWRTAFEWLRVEIP